LLAALDRLDYDKLTEVNQLELLRDYQLICIRMGEPDAAAATYLAKKLDSHYPAKAETTRCSTCSLICSHEAIPRVRCSASNRCLPFALNDST
jgi:hypothetical protein